MDEIDLGRLHEVEGTPHTKNREKGSTRTQTHDRDVLCRRRYHRLGTGQREDLGGKAERPQRPGVQHRGILDKGGQRIYMQEYTAYTEKTPPSEKAQKQDSQ